MSRNEGISFKNLLDGGDLFNLLYFLLGTIFVE